MMLGIIRWVAWNGFLAMIPVALAYSMVALVRLPRQRRWSATVIAALLLVPIWLVFLPNTCYLYTEWRHFLDVLVKTNLYSQWEVHRDLNAFGFLIFVTLFFLGYSLFGAVTFTLAIRPLARWLSGRFQKVWVLGIPFFPTVSLGVYLGLVLRFNSWDLVHRPGIIFSAIFDALTNPNLVAIILAFAALLWFSYWVVDTWVDGFALRFRSMTQRINAR